MKIKKGFVLRDVAGRSVVVATGAAAKRFRGMVMLNETGKEIWTRLQKGMDQVFLPCKYCIMAASMQVLPVKKCPLVKAKLSNTIKKEVFYHE